MSDFCAVTIRSIGISNGEKINSLIADKQLIYNIEKKNSTYSVDFLINNTDLNLSDLIYNNISDNFCIISEDDYISLIKLLYTDNKQLINYNDNYYIIEIQSHFKFIGDDKTVETVREKFLNNIQKRNDSQ